MNTGLLIAFAVLTIVVLVCHPKLMRMKAETDQKVKEALAEVERVIQEEIDKINQQHK